MEPADRRTDVLIAVTFAEAGEWETARQFAPPPGSGRLRGWLCGWIERHLVAAALAEEALHDAALQVLRTDAPAGRTAGDADALDALLRARGMRISFGVLSPEALGVRPG